MKKRVRIYKPTNKFAEGGQQATQFTPDQLVSIYMTALSEPGSSPEDAENVLRQIGVDENSIASITDSVENYVDDEQYYNDALSTADEDAYADMTADQAAQDAAYQEEQDALALAEEEARSDRMQQMYADYSEPDYSDDTDVANQMLMRVGGLPPKKTFLKNVIKQIKKQAGGPSENAIADSTDPDNKRKESLQAFTKAVQVDGDVHLAKEDAQRMYEMLATPVGQEESYYEEPDMDYAQFGGMRRGQMRRMNRRLNRMIGQLPVGFSGMPGRPMIPNVYDYTDLVGAFGMSQMPADGSYYRGPRMANIDVRRTGLFGRPKEYSITFADDVYQNPQTAANTAKQEVINKEEEIEDEVKAAEEGTVDQGVEEKKAEEAAVAAEDDAPVDINDIQVVSVSEEEETPSASGPAFKGFWKGYDPKSVRFAGSNKDRAYIQRGSKWFVSPNFTAKDKKNVQWYEVSDPNRIKNIERNTRTIMDPLAPGTTYSVSESNPRPLPQGRSLPTHSVYGDKSQSLGDYVGSGQIFNEIGQDIMRGANPKRFLGQSNMKKANKSLWLPGSPNSGSGYRESIGMGEKFQEGGFSDQDSGLFRFIDGGADQGKLTQDPYFAYGGYFETAGQTDETAVDILDVNGNVVRQGTLAEAERAGLRHRVRTDKPQQKSVNNNRRGYFNPYMGYGYNPYMMGYGMPQFKQKGLPYYTGTGNAYMGNLDDARLKSIDVKNSFFTGMPKKATYNFLVQKHPLTGQPMTQTAPTKQGMFNKGQRDQMFGRRPDTAFESRSRALSWLGSKLRPFGIEGDKVPGNYTPEEQKMISKGYDPNTGLTQEELAKRKAQREAELAGMKLPTRAIPQPNLPEAQLERTQFVNAPSGISQSMQMRKPNLFSTNIEDAQIIPTNYGTPDFSSQYQDPETMLEPDYGQREVQGLESNSIFQPTSLAEFTQPAVPQMSEQSFNQDLANQNQAAAQDFMLEQIRRQNPEYNQDVYNNPVFNPEEMTTGNVIDFNAPVVTPQQLAETIEQRNNKVPTRRQVPSRVIKNKPPKEQAPVVKEQPVIKKQPDTNKVIQPRPSSKKSNQYNYEQEVKGMSPQEKLVLLNTQPHYQAKQAEGFIELKDLKEQAMGNDINEFKNYYKNYKIPKEHTKSIEKLNPSQRAKYIKSIKNVDLDLYNALLYKYGEYGGYMAYGGTLPQAYVGEDTPINQDERFAPDYESVNWGADFNQDNIPDYLGASTTDMNWKKMPDWMNKPKGFDNEGQYSPQKMVEDMNPEYEDVSTDFKTKWGDRGANRMWLDIFNTAGNRVLDWVGQRGDREKERKQRERLLADNLYGSTGQRNKGWVDTNSGLDIAAQYGQRESAPQGRYGGMMYKEGGVTWLSPEQVKWIRDNGGEIEFVQ